MKFKWHPEALDEYEEAALYYRSEQFGLDVRFIASIEAAIDRVIVAPATWPVLDGRVRRHLTSRFPYSLLYVELPEYLLILAVMHQSRKPDYWKHRIE